MGYIKKFLIYFFCSFGITLIAILFMYFYILDIPNKISSSYDVLFPLQKYHLYVSERIKITEKNDFISYSKKYPLVFVEAVNEHDQVFCLILLESDLNNTKEIQKIDLQINEKSNGISKNLKNLFLKESISRERYIYIASKYQLQGSILKILINSIIASIILLVTEKFIRKMIKGLLIRIKK